MASCLRASSSLFNRLNRWNILAFCLKGQLSMRITPLKESAKCVLYLFDCFVDSWCKLANYVHLNATLWLFWRSEDNEHVSAKVLLIAFFCTTVNLILDFLEIDDYQKYSSRKKKEEIFEWKRSLNWAFKISRLCCSILIWASIVPLNFAVLVLLTVLASGDLFIRLCRFGMLVFLSREWDRFLCGDDSRRLPESFSSSYKIFSNDMKQINAQSKWAFLWNAICLFSVIYWSLIAELNGEISIVLVSLFFKLISMIPSEKISCFFEKLMFFEEGMVALRKSHGIAIPSQDLLDKMGTVDESCV
ncbi:hypothetical protein [Candidatus Similichlamydia epinepheli]|uniref:hypothetical protein n=1 Tax=Candidatus Similichlamydia epinepheli TaxID=1903953 RepID=UPI001300A389|nr:hypothetical protein [Candidatus Similichlamydia epinepheli]